MSHRVRFDSDSRCSAELLKVIQPRLFSSDECGGTPALCGAQIDQAIQIVVAAGQAKNRPAYQHVTHGTDREPIGFGCRVNMIHRCSTCGAQLVLDNDGGFSWNMFFQIRDQGPRLQITVTAWRPATQYDECFSLVVRDLSPAQSR